MDDETDLVRQVQALQRRVQELEDRWEVLQVVAAYGPAVDAGDADAVADLWTEDGTYDVDGAFVMSGRDAIAAMVSSDAHQGYIHAGAGHLQQVPHVEVDGDTAVALHHAQLVLRDEHGYRVDRVTAHRWDLVRTADGWRATNRRAQVLDGGATGRDVLAGRWRPQREE